MKKRYPEKSKLPQRLEQDPRDALSHLKEQRACYQPRQCGRLPRNPSPSTKLGKCLEKGPSPNTVPSAPFPKRSGMSGQKGPGYAGGDSTEETMDVSGPAQEKETSSRKGTGARAELIWQTSKPGAKRWDSKTEVLRFERRKTQLDRLAPPPVRRWAREGKEQGSFLC